MHGEHHRRNILFFFSSRRRHTRWNCDWSSDVCSSDLKDVLIEVAASSICGTDVHIFDWNDWARRHIRPPRVFGHEMSGRVVAVGSDVREVEPGTYVAAETNVVDHTCRQCRRGLYHLCETVQDIRRVNGGVGVDIVLEMSGHPTAVEQGLQVLHNGGWISLLGIGDRPVTLDLNDLVVTKSITIYGIFGRRIWDTWERTSSYLSTGRVDVSPLITHRFPLDDFQEAMAQMKSGRAGKVVLLPSGG